MKNRLFCLLVVLACALMVTGCGRDTQSSQQETNTVSLELGEDNPAPEEESIRLLRKSTVDYEFRTTLVRELHRPEDLDAIAAWLAGAPRYYLQNFVDSGNLIGRGYHGFTAEQLQGFAERVRPFFGAVELRGID